jgi:peptidoglycan hydrolase-like protein with peptidoglycan-binding domain
MQDRPGQIQYVHRMQALVGTIGWINNLSAAKALKYPVSGAFDPATLAGVKAVQHFFGLVQDGIVGPNTWRKLIGA